MKSKRFTFFSALVLSVLVFSLVSPGIALADEGTPPPSDAGSSESAPSDSAPSNSGSSDSAPSDTAPSDSAPSDSAPSDSAPSDAVPSDSTPSGAAPSDPAPVDSAPADAAPTDAAPGEAAPAESATPIADLPANTGVVALDANGAALPLATQAAADVITTGDPMWCPEGVAPGGTGCSGSFSTLTGPSGLLANFDIASQGVNGVIWIEAGARSEVDTSVDIFGNPATTTSLTLQGGWSGASGDTSTPGTSTYNVPLNIFWGGNVTIKNITISGADPGANDAALVVETSNGNINLENVIVENTTTTGEGEADGAHLLAGFSTSDTGDGVTIKNSHFNKNQGLGLVTEAVGNTSLANVSADENGKGGAWLTSINGTVTINNSSFSNNNVFSNNDSFPGAGLVILSWGISTEVPGGIFLDHVNANGNAGPGAYLLPVGGDTNITNSTFNNNNIYGLAVQNFLGNIYLKNVSASGNRADIGENQIVDEELSPGFGALLVAGNGNISVSNSFFNNNWGNGLVIGAVGGLNTNSVVSTDPEVPASLPIPTISLYNVQANGNGSDGLYLLGDAGTPANITIECSTFNNNGGDGINAYNPDGSTSLISVVAAGNGNENINIGGPITIGNMQCESIPSGSKVNRKGWKPGIGNGFKVPFACEDYMGLMLTLPNNDFVKFPCSVGNGASANAIPASNLPALPNQTVVSALGFTIFGSSGNSQAIVGFQLPAGETGGGYSILFWDGANWVDVGGSLSPDGYFEATVNASGIYVLVH